MGEHKVYFDSWKAMNCMYTVEIYSNIPSVLWSVTVRKYIKYIVWKSVSYVWMIYLLQTDTHKCLERTYFKLVYFTFNRMYGYSH